MASKLFPEASFTALIVTPGSTPAVESVTVPLTVASCACPVTGTARIVRIEPTKINRRVTLDVMQTSSPYGRATDSGSRRDFHLAALGHRYIPRSAGRP